MKAHGPDVEQTVERRRQHVLAGVLLHVIESACPVDEAAHTHPGFEVQGAGFRVRSSGFKVQRSGFGVRGCAFHDVRDRAVFLIDDVHDAQRAEHARVERLPARRRIERRAIERDDEAIVAALNAPDGRVKGVEIGVAVIQAVGHRTARS